MKLSIVPTIEEASRPDHGSALQQLGRKLFLAKLAQFRAGELTVVDGREQFTFGRRTPACTSAMALPSIPFAGWKATPPAAAASNTSSMTKR